MPLKRAAPSSESPACCYRVRRSRCSPGRRRSQPRRASKSTADDVRILNSALGAELEAIAAYQVGAESGLLQKPVLDLAVTFQGHHKEHADILRQDHCQARRQGGRRQGASTRSRPTRSRRRPTCCDLRRRSKRARSAPISAPCRCSATATSPRPPRASSATRRCTGRSLRNALGEAPVPVAFMS